MQFYSIFYCRRWDTFPFIQIYDVFNLHFRKWVFLLAGLLQGRSGQHRETIRMAGNVVYLHKITYITTISYILLYDQIFNHSSGDREATILITFKFQKCPSDFNETWTPCTKATFWYYWSPYRWSLTSLDDVISKITLLRKKRNFLATFNLSKI